MPHNPNNSYEYETTYWPIVSGPGLAHRIRELREHIDKTFGYGYDPASRGGDQSAVSVLSTAGGPLYEECLATQDVPTASSVGSGDQDAANRFASTRYHQDFWRKMFKHPLLVESDAHNATQCLGAEPAASALEAANRTIAVLRDGIDKANAEIMRLRDDLARRPAAFVEPPAPDKPNPFRDFTTDRRRMGPP